MDIERFGQQAFLSNAVGYQGVLWISGMVAGPQSVGQPIATQAADILDQLDTRLAASGSDRGRLLSVNIWLADIADWAAMNAVWTAWLADGPAPARATVQAGLVPPYRIEIAAVAARG